MPEEYVALVFEEMELIIEGSFLLATSGKPTNGGEIEFMGWEDED